MKESVRTSGVALITSLAIVAIVAVLVVGSVFTTQLELATTRNDTNSVQAQYVAQAGLQTYKATLFQTYRAAVAEAETADTCASTVSTSIDLNRDGSPLSWTNDTIELPVTNVLAGDGSVVGTFEVTFLRDPDDQSIITVRSVGRATNDGTTIRATSTASATYILSTGSSIEQAIFAGDGSGMRSINGNAKVYGGVYIEGDRDAYLADGSQPSVFDASGNFSMFNTYDANDLNSGNYRPADLMTNPQVPNLCASMRVGYGSITVGGSAQLGQPDEGRLLSVDVGQGGGNVIYDGDVIEGDTDGICRNNKGVCSFTPVGAYDLDEVIDFPELDELPANAEACGSGVLWRDCIKNEATRDGLRFPVAGDVSLSNGLSVNSTTCSELLIDALASGTLTFGSTEIDCVTEGEGFRYTTAGPSNKQRGTLEVFGHVNFTGLDVNFDLPTEYLATSDGGDNAGLFVEEDASGNGGSIFVQSDFVPDQGTISSSAMQYPDTVLTLVAEKMVTLNGGNGTTVTAPVYAGDLFRIRANSTLVGQVIANTFCSMGNPNSLDCNNSGTPPTIIFSSAGANRPESYKAIAEPGGTPTFQLLSYEMR